MSNSLPMAKILKSSFANPGNHLKSIFSVFWPVLLLGAAASYFSYVSIITTEYSGASPKSAIISTILTVLFFISFIPMNVCWVEHVITKQPPKFNFDKRIFLSIGYALLIILFYLIPISIVSVSLFTLGQEAGMGTGLGVVLIVSFGIVWLTYTYRFILVLPAIAMSNGKTRMRRSWDLTKGYQFKLLLLFIVPNILVQIPTTIVEKGIGIFIYDAITFSFSMSLVTIFSIYGALLYAEISARVFVFFHAPEKLDSYV